MIKLTPQQIQRIKQTFGAADENEIFIAAYYLQKHLDNLEINAFYAGTAPEQTIIDEIKIIITKYSSEILALINQTALKTLTHREAIKLAAQLLADSSTKLINETQELKFTNNLALQAITPLLTEALKKDSEAEPEQILHYLIKLFDVFPETKQLSVLIDLANEVDSIIENKKDSYQLVSYTKETLGMQARINLITLTNARFAFQQWVHHRKSYSGLLREIIELTDKLASKYPVIKKIMLGFVSQLFLGNLIEKHLAPKFFAKFTDIINVLIAIDDKQSVYSLCFHLVNNKNSIQPWTLIEIFDHPNFKKFTRAEQRLLFQTITASLNQSNSPQEVTNFLRALLKKCENPELRFVYLQRLNEFYQGSICPTLVESMAWLNELPNQPLEETYISLGEKHLRFIKECAPKEDEIIFIRQFNKLKIDLDGYSKTSIFHTRKQRADKLDNYCTSVLTDIDLQSPEQKRQLFLKAISELYLQYASIENASGILSKHLEKRLIKILRVPKDDALKAAFAKRETFSYKFSSFFTAGRAFFKNHRDKDTDPVHQVILQHMSHELRTSVNHAKERATELDRLDRRETSIGGLRREEHA